MPPNDRVSVSACGHSDFGTAGDRGTARGESVRSVSKVAGAKKHGVTVLSEDEWLELIGE